MSQIVIIVIIIIIVIFYDRLSRVASSVLMWTVINKDPT